MKNKEDIYPISRPTGIRFMRVKKNHHVREQKGKQCWGKTRFPLEQGEADVSEGDFGSNEPGMPEGTVDQFQEFTWDGRRQNRNYTESYSD